MRALGTNFEGIPLRYLRTSLANSRFRILVRKVKRFTAKFAKEIRKGRKERHMPRSIPIELAKPAKFCKNNGLSQPA
jgi:hypothetical protein